MLKESLNCVLQNVFLIYLTNDRNPLSDKDSYLLATIWHLCEISVDLFQDILNNPLHFILYQRNFYENYLKRHVDATEVA